MSKMNPQGGVVASAPERVELKQEIILPPLNGLKCSIALTMPPAVRACDALPCTARVAIGEVVPMPTWPEAVRDITSIPALSLRKLSLLAPCDETAPVFRMCQDIPPCPVVCISTAVQTPDSGPCSRIARTLGCETVRPHVLGPPQMAWLFVKTLAAARSGTLVVSRFSVTLPPLPPPVRSVPAVTSVIVPAPGNFWLLINVTLPV